jgi:predicted DNA binding protein
MAALRAGYFELPRDCTLADVAATLDIDKSTASRVLRRGQTRIVKWFLTTAGTQSSQSPERR